MTISQCFTWAIKKLKSKKINSAQLDAEILLCHVLNKDKPFLYSHPQKIVSSQRLTKYKKYILRRAKHEPVAYITGHKQFYGLDFYVNKNVLIPRPDTELMVDEALKQLKTMNSAITLIDLGTGSGCIPINIIKNLKAISYKLKPNFYATDISRRALYIARKNAKLHKVDKRIKFIHGKLLQLIIKQFNHLAIQPSNHLVITANLPYLTPQQYKDNPDLKYEPKQALVAKNNGLEFYEKLFKQLTGCQIPATCYLEIDPSQTIVIKKLIKKYFPLTKISIKKDINRLNRLIMVKL